MSILKGEQPLRHGGLAKLTEECGELQQVVGKLLQYPELIGPHNAEAHHPDGTNLRKRLQEEMGDVLASVDYVSKMLALDRSVISDRASYKRALYDKWSRNA